MPDDPDDSAAAGGDVGWTPGALPPSSVPRSARWAPFHDFVRDRLPLSFRGVRVDPGVAGAIGLALLALIAGITAVAMASLAGPRPSRPVAVQPKVAVPPLRSAGPVPTASASSEVVVDVAGTVRRPGLVTLHAGARVADAIAGAGGALPGTNTVGLSLARRLVDGEQLVVGAAQPPGAGAGGVSRSASTGGVVNLNAATLSDLDGLPGIGPVLAQRILDWRAAHGGFTSVDQLQQVSGLGGHKFETLAPLVSV